MRTKVATSHLWDSMSPEERNRNPFLENLSSDILGKPWSELPQETKDHVTLLLPSPELVDIKIHPDYTEVGDLKVYPRRIIIVTEAGKELQLEIKKVGGDPENLEVSLRPTGGAA